MMWIPERESTSYFRLIHGNTIHQKSCIVQHMDYIYPAQNTIIETEDKRANRFYMVIAVGEISISSKIDAPEIMHRLTNMENSA